MTPAFQRKFIEPPFLALCQALDDLRAGELRAQTTVLAKKKDLEKLKATTRSVAKNAETFLNLAGMEEDAPPRAARTSDAAKIPARRRRPTTTRRRRRQLEAVDSPRRTSAAPGGF